MLELTDVELVVDQRILELQCAALLIEGDTMGAAMLMDRIGACLGYKAYRQGLITETAEQGHRGRPKGSKNKMTRAERRVWNSLTPDQRAAIDEMEAKGEVTVGFGPELNERETDKLAQDHDDAVRYAAALEKEDL